MIKINNQSIDLSHEQFNIVTSVLKQHVPNHTVWAFGSRILGTARQYSDLDLVIISDKPLGLAKLADISEAFSESDLPFKVDVADWANTAEDFQKIIAKQKVVIQ